MSDLRALHQQAKQAEGNALTDFAESFTYSLIDAPLDALRQIQGQEAIHEAPSRKQVGTSNWVAQEAGAVLGTLPYFLVTHKLLGKGFARFKAKTYAGKLALCSTRSAMTGFTVDSTLKPTEIDSGNHDFLRQRIANGTSSALTFAFLGGAGAASESIAIKAVTRATAKEVIGNSAFANLVRSEAVNGRLAGALSGATLGVPAGFIGAESNSLLLKGKHASAETLASSMLSASMMGTALGGLQQLKTIESKADAQPSPHKVKRDSIIEHSDGTRTTVGPKAYELKEGDSLVHVTPIFKIGSFAFFNNRDIRLLERAVANLKQQACTDALTGLANNKAGEMALETGFHAARRNNRSLSVVFLDLDGFKAVNDQIGHHQGDLVLKQVAEKLNQLGRGQDTIYRKGGDEFVVVLPETSSLGAEQVARRIQESVQLEIKHPDGQRTLKVGTSAGVCTFEPQLGNFESVGQLLKYADEMMYANKKQRKSFKYTNIPSLVSGINSVQRQLGTFNINISLAERKRND